jgi:hypothetical protein
MTSTGKRARKQFGNRFAAKAAKASKSRDRRFGSLKYSVVAKNTDEFIFNVYPNVVARAAEERKRRGIPFDSCAV